MKTDAAIFGFALAILGLALTASAQQISVAVLPSDGTVLSNDELEVLTDKMRESALKVLPLNTFVLLKQVVGIYLAVRIGLQLAEGESQVNI